MAKINKLDKSGLDAARKALQDYLDDAAMELGLEISFGNGKYSHDGTWGELKLKLATKTPAGEPANSPERTAYQKLCQVYGLQPEWLDQTFTQQGHTYKIMGLKTRAKKYPVIAIKVSTGERFKFPESTVRFAMDTGC